MNHAKHAQQCTIYNEQCKCNTVKKNTQRSYAHSTVQMPNFTINGNIYNFKKNCDKKFVINGTNAKFYNQW